MQITRATEYAVRCALHLALEQPERVVPRREIAGARGIPEQFLGKIAQRLSRAGIIRIHQGARGGYELLLPASRLTLLAVVEAAEGDLVLNACVMHPLKSPAKRALFGGECGNLVGTASALAVVGFGKVGNLEKRCKSLDDMPGVIKRHGGDEFGHLREKTLLVR